MDFEVNFEQEIEELLKEEEEQERPSIPPAVAESKPSLSTYQEPLVAKKAIFKPEELDSLSLGKLGDGKTEDTAAWHPSAASQQQARKSLSLPVLAVQHRADAEGQGAPAQSAQLLPPSQVQPLGSAGNPVPISSSPPRTAEHSQHRNDGGNLLMDLVNSEAGISWQQNERLHGDPQQLKALVKGHLVRIFHAEKPELTYNQVLTVCEEASGLMYWIADSKEQYLDQDHILRQAILWFQKMPHLPSEARRFRRDMKIEIEKRVKDAFESHLSEGDALEMAVSLERALFFSCSGDMDIYKDFQTLNARLVKAILSSDQPPYISLLALRRTHSQSHHIAQTSSQDGISGPNDQYSVSTQEQRKVGMAAADCERAWQQLESMTLKAWELHHQWDMLKSVNKEDGYDPSDLTQCLEALRNMLESGWACKQDLDKAQHEAEVQLDLAKKEIERLKAFSPQRIDDLKRRVESCDNQVEEYPEPAPKEITYAYAKAMSAIVVCERALKGQRNDKNCDLTQSSIDEMCNNVADYEELVEEWIDREEPSSSQKYFVVRKRQNMGLSLTPDNVNRRIVVDAVHPDAPEAVAANLQPGDFITSFNGTELASYRKMGMFVNAILREGMPVGTKMKIGMSRPVSKTPSSCQRYFFVTKKKNMGLSLKPDNVHRRIVVDAVRSYAPEAVTANLQPGDFITHLNGTDLANYSRMDLFVDGIIQVLPEGTEMTIGMIRPAPECKKGHKMKVDRSGLCCNKCRSQEFGQRWLCVACIEGYCLGCEPSRDAEADIEDKTEVSGQRPQIKGNDVERKSSNLQAEGKALQLGRSCKVVPTSQKMTDVPQRAEPKPKGNKETEDSSMRKVQEVQSQTVVTSTIHAPPESLNYKGPTTAKEETDITDVVELVTIKKLGNPLGLTVRFDSKTCSMSIKSIKKSAASEIRHALKVGDQLLKMNGVVLNSREIFTMTYNAVEPGNDIVFEVIPNGSMKPHLEMKPELKLAKPEQLSNGTKVSVSWPGNGQFYKATICETRYQPQMGSATYALMYEDGSYEVDVTANRLFIQVQNPNLQAESIANTQVVGKQSQVPTNNAKYTNLQAEKKGSPSKAQHYKKMHQEEDAGSLLDGVPKLKSQTSPDSTHESLRKESPTAGNIRIQKTRIREHASETLGESVQKNDEDAPLTVVFADLLKPKSPEPQEENEKHIGKKESSLPEDKAKRDLATEGNVERNVDSDSSNDSSGDYQEGEETCSEESEDEFEPVKRAEIKQLQQGAVRVLHQNGSDGRSSDGLGQQRRARRHRHLQRNFKDPKKGVRLPDGISKEQSPRKRDREDFVGSEQSVGPKPKRGRPGKEGNQGKLHEEQVKPSQEKRGRGRRRKYPQPQENSEVGSDDVPEEEDGNVDICSVCKKGGGLVCCDSCPRAFHLICLRLKKKDLPEGKWACPRCEEEDQRDFLAVVCPEEESDPAKATLSPIQLCVKLVDFFALHEFASDFLDPIDWEELGFVGYKQIIQTPMDLGTIKKRLDGNHYNSAVGVLTDLRLVWHNCKTYNTEGSAIWRMADHLSRLLERFYQTRLKPRLSHLEQKNARKEKGFEDERFTHSKKDEEVQENTAKPMTRTSTGHSSSGKQKDEEKKEPIQDEHFTHSKKDEEVQKSTAKPTTRRSTRQSGSAKQKDEEKQEPIQDEPFIRSKKDEQGQKKNERPTTRRLTRQSSSARHEDEKKEEPIQDEPFLRSKKHEECQKNEQKPMTRRSLRRSSSAKHEEEERQRSNQEPIVEMVPCDFCSKMIKSQHVSKHHRFCPKKTSGDLEVQTPPPKEAVPTERVPCEFCSKPIQRRFLNYHLRSCPVKNYSSKLHQSQKSEAPTEEDGDKVPCKLCSKPIHNDDMSRHLKFCKFTAQSRHSQLCKFTTQVAKSNQKERISTRRNKASCPSTAPKRSKRLKRSQKGDSEAVDQDEDKKIQEKTPSVKLCAICKLPGKQVSCQSCPRSFHHFCLGSKDVPESTWECAICTKEAEPDSFDDIVHNAQDEHELLEKISFFLNSYGLTSHNLKTEDVPVDGQQGDHEGKTPRMKLCAICEQPESLVSCQSCPRSFHLFCLGSKDVPEGTWVCAICTKEAEPDFFHDIAHNAYDEQEFLENIYSFLKASDLVSHYLKPGNIPVKGQQGDHEIIHEQTDFGRILKKVQSKMYSSHLDLMRDLLSVTMEKSSESTEEGRLMSKVGCHLLKTLVRCTRESLKWRSHNSNRIYTQLQASRSPKQMQGQQLMTRKQMIKKLKCLLDSFFQELENRNPLICSILTNDVNTEEIAKSTEEELFHNFLVNETLPDDDKLEEKAITRTKCKSRRTRSAVDTSYKWQSAARDGVDVIFEEGEDVYVWWPITLEFYAAKVKQRHTDSNQGKIRVTYDVIFSADGWFERNVNQERVKRGKYPLNEVLERHIEKCMVLAFLEIFSQKVQEHLSREKSKKDCTFWPSCTESQQGYDAFSPGSTVIVKSKPGHEEGEGKYLQAVVDDVHTLGEVYFAYDVTYINKENKEKRVPSIRVRAVSEKERTKNIGCSCQQDFSCLCTLQRMCPYSHTYKNILTNLNNAELGCDPRCVQSIFKIQNPYISEFNFWVTRWFLHKQSLSISRTSYETIQVYCLQPRDSAYNICKYGLSTNCLGQDGCSLYTNVKKCLTHEILNANESTSASDYCFIVMLLAGNLDDLCQSESTSYINSSISSFSWKDKIAMPLYLVEFKTSCK